MHAAGSGGVFRMLFLLMNFKVSLIKVSFSNLFGVIFQTVCYKRAEKLEKMQTWKRPECLLVL